MCVHLFLRLLLITIFEIENYMIGINVYAYLVYNLTEMVHSILSKFWILPNKIGKNQKFENVLYSWKLFA